MHIAIYASGMPFNGESIPTGMSLGGSESAAYYMAKELKRLGHNIVVFTNSQEKGRWDDVTYEYHGKQSKEFPLGDRFHFTMQVPYDVVIVQRHPMGFLHHINAKVKLWWLHDLALIRHSGLVQNHLINFDRILTVSEFHKNQVAEIYDIPKDFIVPTWNGVDYSMFDSIRQSISLGMGYKQSNTLCFAARPERGLNELVGQDSIMEQLPDCHLYVCSYLNTTNHMKDFYNYLWARCEELPNVTNVGALGKKELYELLGKSMLYVYPTTFEDTSCIMVMEANAAGTPFISFEQAALPETCKDSGSVLLPLIQEMSNIQDGVKVTIPQQADKKLFAKTVKKILSDKSKWDNLHQKALKKNQAWESAAIQWDQLFKDILSEKSQDQHRLFKHLEHYSDVYCIKEQAKEQLWSNYHFMYDGAYEEHYDRYYQYEKDRGVVYGEEDLTGNPRFEQTAMIVDELKPKSIMDYGCAHGHYVMNLMKRFPDVRYFGVDINESNIKTAKKWAFDEIIKNEPLKHKCSSSALEIVDNLFMQNEAGNHFKLAQKVDMIIVAEVLEHVPDPASLIRHLKQYLNPDGVFLITTPYGAWEAIGYDEHKGWRAHIHHLERQDLFELFGDQKEYKLLALPHRDELGHFFVTFKNSDVDIGQIDYERKLRSQAPQETLSVCIIAKDSELTIGKTLKGISKIADEIIVGIDETTTDETKRVCESFGAKTFKIPCPVLPVSDPFGFDEARKLTIAKAKMDWILWIDDDETLEQIENLPKYLRPNCFDGYGIKQHHYAVEPAALFKTDFPVRLFRNHKGIKFYGVVHEHPEKIYNEGVGKVIILQDVAIMHTGYSTEAIRRKRFERNFPLIKKDRKKYPDRKLGKFLWLRDLSHLVKYKLEGNGGRMTPEIQGYAENVIMLWRELLEEGNSRFIADALVYYSEAVNVLGGGIEYSIDVKAQTNGHKSSFVKSPLVGLFANKEDIKGLMIHLTDETTKPYGEKYF